MKQVVQPVSGGPVRVVDVPRPNIGPSEVLVQTVASVLSPGTERAVTALARSNLVAKAKARPDLVRQVVKKARTDGIAPALRAVRSRLGDDVPLGYSAAGIALEVGEHVAGVAPGQLVATAGAGKANHAEFQAVPGLLCVPVPDGVPAADASFATVASIALHAFRLADVGPGAKVAVVGLGLIGHLALRVARAAGCDVAGIDLVDVALERARRAGALALCESGDDTTEAVAAWSRGRGVDAVLLCAADRTSAVISRTPALCRDRAAVVVVGDLGLELSRTPFYEKELSVRFARSYGPGRYERSYEDWGVDYPPGFVRWTEGRNLEAVLDLMASGQLEVADLVSHRFPIAEASGAYELVETRSEPFLGIQFVYPESPAPDGPIVLRPTRRTDSPGIGLVGAGAFAKGVLLPSLRQAGFERFVAVASASGLSARRVAERAGFEKAVSSADLVIDDPDVEVVMIATRHDSHADLTVRALRAGKHVFCEKPLALTTEELDRVEEAWRESGAVLFVGFNRRWSEPVRRVRDHFVGGSGPLVITYRVNAGRMPESHWYHDRRQGGRLIGEVCHFVDTCSAIVAAEPVVAHALGSGRAEPLLEENLGILLRYADGSVVAITYANGGHALEKERVEIVGRGRSAVIIDFREVLLDGEPVALARNARDKGHRASARALRAMLAQGRPSVESALVSSRVVLDALASMLGTVEDK